MGIPGNISTLVGVGFFHMWRGSAIAATAPVINADDDEVAAGPSDYFLFQCIGCTAISRFWKNDWL